jgi:hypothetical protein
MGIFFEARRFIVIFTRVHQWTLLGRWILTPDFSIVIFDIIRLLTSEVAKVIFSGFSVPECSIQGRSVLGGYAVSTGKYLSTFRMSVVPTSSGTSSSLLDHLTLSMDCPPSNRHHHHHHHHRRRHRHHELGPNRRVSASSNSLFKGLPSRLRPFGL